MVFVIGKHLRLILVLLNIVQGLFYIVQHLTSIGTVKILTRCPLCYFLQEGLIELGDHHLSIFVSFGEGLPIFSNRNGAPLCRSQTNSKDTNTLIIDLLDHLAYSLLMVFPIREDNKDFRSLPRVLKVIYRRLYSFSYSCPLGGEHIGIDSFKKYLSC